MDPYKIYDILNNLSDYRKKIQTEKNKKSYNLTRKDYFDYIKKLDLSKSEKEKLFLMLTVESKYFNKYMNSIK